MDKNRFLKGFKERVALLALMMSLVALSIDTVLPALANIGRELGIQRANDNQYVISMLIFGMAGGQMFYGPLSDSIGRKPAIYIGLVVYAIGSMLSAVTLSFPTMITGRIMQGLGAAGPRVVTLALVRDQYAGREMARVMSIVMSIFIFVPIIAPTLGQAILMVVNWRAIFWCFACLSLITMVWFGIRQQETLALDHRIPFSLSRIFKGIREVCTTRVSIGYTIATGLVFGSFFGYINSAQQIFQELYDLGKLFPIVFGALAFSLSIALFLNTRFIRRHGMRLLVRRALLGICSLSTVFFTIALVFGGRPPLWILIIYLATSFFCIGLLFGNLNAIAMQPLGHIAGVGAAVVGFLSTLIAVPIGILIGQCYNQSVLPLVGGFTVFCVGSLLVSLWVESHGLATTDRRKIQRSLKT